LTRLSILGLLVGVAAGALAVGSSSASAETMSGALSRAYDNNPDINQQRAAVRAKDEGVPGAKAGWLPKVNGNASYGRQLTVLNSPSGTSVRGKTVDRTLTSPQLLGASVTQTLFDGNSTSNSVRQAQASVAMARENLRLTELSTLNLAAAAYMDVLRDTAVLGLRANNIKVLEVQLRQTRDRFQVGEVTRTDVAQAESSLAGSQADYSLAQSNLDASIAKYRLYVGGDPKRLDPAQPIERLLPRSLAAAIEISTTEHPAVTAALHQVDMAELQVKIKEAALLPTVNLQGSVSQQTDYNGVPGYNVTTASLLGQVVVPIYQGGAEYAGIRAAKEQLSQTMLTVELQRSSVRSAVATSWGQLQAARAAITAYQAAVKAAEVALNGVREEAKVGQRTTLDVLNAQQTLLNTRVQLVSAQHDRVVYSYAVMANSGLLSAASLGLGVVAYDPNIHYDQVKNKFFGWNTPDGR